MAQEPASLKALIDKYMLVRVKRIKNPLVRRTAGVLAAPVVYKKHARQIQYELRGQRVLPYVEVFLTTKCSLRCTYCAAAMPSYRALYDIDYAVIEDSLRAFLSNIDFIENVRLLGGEPFLYPALDRVIAFILENYRDKVGQVTIVTNATIVPRGDSLLAAMNDPLVVVDISNYGAHSTKIDALVALQKQYKFRVIVNPQLKWSVPQTDYGCRNLTDAQLAARFAACKEHCRLIRDGKLFYCGPAFWAMFTDGGYDEGDFVDLLHPKDPARLHDEIVDLYFNKPYFHACDYCPGGFSNRPLELQGGADQLPRDACQPFDMPPGFDEVQQRKI